MIMPPMKEVLGLAATFKISIDPSGKATVTSHRAKGLLLILDLDEIKAANDGTSYDISSS